VNIIKEFHPDIKEPIDIEQFTQDTTKMNELKILKITTYRSGSNN
jgi:hypothetical protein